MTRRGPRSTGDAGAIVRALFDAAEAGDPVANEVVERHGAAIGQVAAAAARRVGIDREPYPLAFCGGVARGGARRLITAALDAVTAAGQAPRLTDARWEPAVGALLIGLSEAGSLVDRPAVEARLEATLPPPQLFEPGG